MQNKAARRYVSDFLKNGLGLLDQIPREVVFEIVYFDEPPDACGTNVTMNIPFPEGAKLSVSYPSDCKMIETAIRLPNGNLAEEFGYEAQIQRWSDPSDLADEINRVFKLKPNET